MFSLEGYGWGYPDVSWGAAEEVVDE